MEDDVELNIAANGDASFDWNIFDLLAQSGAPDRDCPCTVPVNGHEEPCQGFQSVQSVDGTPMYVCNLYPQTHQNLVSIPNNPYSNFLWEIASAGMGALKVKLKLILKLLEDVFLKNKKLIKVPRGKKVELKVIPRELVHRLRKATPRLPKTAELRKATPRPRKAAAPPKATPRPRKAAEPPKAKPRPRKAAGAQKAKPRVPKAADVRKVKPRPSKVAKRS